MKTVLVIAGIDAAGILLAVIALAIATVLVIAFGKGVRVLVRRASARRAAQAASPDHVSLPVLLDLRRPARATPDHAHRAQQENWTEDTPW